VQNQEIKEQIEAIRLQVSAILNDLIVQTRQFGLPPLPTSLEDYRQKLASNTYNVLVVGEAKRGKSSFVNALIARELLPTDVDIATNQVFRVTNAPNEAYRLRFEDGSTQSITAEELLEYGSQSFADLRKYTSIDFSHLHWIEVDLPVRLLPEGLSILDTPGMGTLYAAHAQITQRFVPLADAIIYVLDSSQPVTQFELDFISSILDTTTHIFFIQTKIDQFDKADWQSVQKRHEEILRSTFKDRLPDPHVWPISSLNLLKALQTNSPALLKVSHQQELLDALQLFLFKVAGWNRCAAALQMARQYYASTRETLISQETLLAEKSTQELNDLHTEASLHGQNLQDEWGTDGNKRQELLEQLKRTVYTGKTAMFKLLDMRGPIESEQRNAIEAVQTLDEANELGGKMFESVAFEVISRWREICEQTRDRCSAILGSFIETIDALAPNPNEPGLTIQTIPVPKLNDGMPDRIDQAQSGFFLGSTLGIILIASLPIALPFAVVTMAIAGSGLWGAFHFWKRSEVNQIKEARQKLNEHLAVIMQDVRRRFIEPDMAYDGKSLVVHYFDLLTEAIQDQIDEVIERKSIEVRQKSALLESQARASRQEREQKRLELQAQLQEWEKIGQEIRETSSAMQALEPAL
jgi:GTP-binding protein EngB required for normal cell division